MISKMVIFNMALGFIGARNISSEDEKTQEAIQCSLYWDSARRQALRDYPWNFAQRRAWLAQVELPSEYEQQYQYAYAMPTDLLQAIKLYPNGEDAEQRNDSESGRFIIVHSDINNISMLLCNAESALLSYTADIQNVALFDDSFVVMIARKLSSLISVSLLKNNAGRAGELEELYRLSIPQAMQADSNEGREKTKEDSWIQSRY